MQIIQQKIPERKIGRKRNFRNWRIGNFRKRKQEFLVEWKARLKSLKYLAQSNNEQLTQSNSYNETITLCVAIFELQILHVLGGSLAFRTYNFNNFFQCSSPYSFLYTSWAVTKHKHLTTYNENFNFKQTVLRKHMVVGGSQEMRMRFLRIFNEFVSR